MKNLEQETQSTLIVVKPASMAASYYADPKVIGKSLQLLESKLIDYALTLADPNDITKPIRFGLDDYWHANGVERVVSKHIALVKAAVLDLPSKLMIYRQLDGNGKEKITSCSYVYQASVLEDNNTCEIQFHPNLANHFSEYREKIIFSYSNIVRLNKKYSYRLYQFAKTILGNEDEVSCKIPITDFLAYMDASTIPARNVKSKILDPSVKEINETDQDIILDYDRHKTNGVYSDLILNIKRREQPSLKDVVDELIPPEEEEAMEDQILSRIYEQIEYEHLAKTFADDSAMTQMLEMVVDIMAYVYSAKPQDCLAINRTNIPVSKVLTQYEKLDDIMVQTVIETVLTSSNGKIKNPRAYLQTALYNIPMTINAQAASESKEARTRENGRRELSPDELEALKQAMVEDNDYDDLPEY